MSTAERVLAFYRTLRWVGLSHTIITITPSSLSLLPAVSELLPNCTQTRSRGCITIYRCKFLNRIQTRLRGCIIILNCMRTHSRQCITSMQLHHSPTIMPTSVCVTAGPHVLEVVGVFIHILFVHINIVTPQHRLISSIAPSSHFEGCIFRRRDMTHFSFIYLLCDGSSCSTYRF